MGTEYMARIGSCFAEHYAHTKMKSCRRQPVCLRKTKYRTDTPMPDGAELKIWFHDISRAWCRAKMK